MESIEGQIYSLNELNAEITIVAFFEPSCGHCKKEIPKLYRQVFEPYRSKGVQVFAVYTLADREEWTNFINEHELYDWINVYDPYHQTHFRDYYDIKSTPTIFILDREKKIIAKKLDVDQMPGFLDYVLSNK
jgi:thiol-disulfide isomerase/thioredoxin